MFDLADTPLSGAIMVAAISAALAFIWTRLPWRSLMWVLTLGAPLLVAYSVYWFPVRSVPDVSEYSHWAPVFIAPWYIAGAASSVIVVVIANRRARMRNRP